MPQVPSYGGPQVAADPLRPVQARALDVSSGTRAIGQGLANLAEGIDRYQEREAQAQAFNAEDALTSQWLEWDSQARKHYVGEKANDYEAAAREWWAKAPETVGTTLNPRARELVGRSLAQKRNSAMASVMTAAGAEKERHADQVALADLNSTMQFGVTTGNVEAARLQIGEKVAAMGARKGWSTEEVQAATGKYLSDMHVAAIDQLPAEQGLAYFQQHRDEIDFDKQGRMEKYLERSIEVERKQREADAEKAKREADERVLDSAWSLYAQRQPVPQSVIAALPGREAAQLLNAIESRAAREAKGEVIKTDPAEYNRVMLDITEGRRVDLRPYSERFETADMDRLVKLQQDMATPEKVPEVATLTQQLNTFTTGFDDAKKKAFTDAVQTEISRQQQAKGRALTFEERRAVMDAQYMEGEVLSGSSWKPDLDKRFYEVAPEDRANWVPDISDDERAQVIEALQKAGIATPTDAQIIQRYKRAKGFQ